MAYSPITLHASCVAVDGRAVLIRGASGQGKSALALELIALGAQLVADDQTILTRRDDALIASCPPALRGMIEARGIGLLAAPPLDHAVLCLIVDLDRVETARLPPRQQAEVLGVAIDLVFAVTHRHFPYGILQYARAGRME